MFVIFHYNTLLIKNQSENIPFQYLTEEREKIFCLLAEDPDLQFSPLFVLRLNAQASPLPQELELSLQISKLKIPFLIQRQIKRQHTISRGVGAGKRKKVAAAAKTLCFLAF